MARYLIVGVDPGTTTAVAALDFRGRVVGLHSSKDMGVAHTLAWILSIGKPSIVASDVAPAPAFVSTIATRFGVRLIFPEKPLPVALKLEMTRSYEAADAHQRDALAAALNAYESVRTKLERVRALSLPDDVAHTVLQGISVSQARAQFEEAGVVEEPRHEPAVQPEQVVSPEQRLIRDLERQARNLRTELMEREGLIRDLRRRLELRERRKPAPAPKSVAEKTAERRIHSMQIRMSRMEKGEKLLQEALSGGIVPVGVWPKVIAGRTLAEALPDGHDGVDVAFTSKNRIRQQMLDWGVAVFDSSELEESHGMHYIGSERLRQLMEKGPSVEDIVEEYRQKRI